MVALSVIIVSYNVRYYLEQCLDSVMRASKGLDAETIVIDNESKDGSIEYLEPLFPRVKFIRAGDNLGFSKANNRAVAESSGRYLLFLNPDTIISENVLADSIRFMDNHPDAGLAGVCMLNPDGTFAKESRRAVPTPFVSFCKMSGLCSLFPKSRLFGRYYLGYLNKDEANRIEIVSGAYMFARRQAFEKTGGFDESFFMYGEDVDLSYRVLKAGYENWYIPVRILHYKGESTNKTSYAYSRTFYNAMLIFFDKHFHGYGKLSRLMVWLVLRLRTLLTYIGNNISIDGAEKKSVDWLYAGHPEHFDDIAGIADIPGGSLLTSGMSLPQVDSIRDYTVYDTSAFTYGEIIGNMSCNAGLSMIATYNPDKGILLIHNGNVMRDGETGV